MFCTVNGCDCQLIIKENYDDDDDAAAAAAFSAANWPSYTTDLIPWMADEFHR